MFEWMIDVGGAGETTAIDGTIIRADGGSEDITLVDGSSEDFTLASQYPFMGKLKQTRANKQEYKLTSTMAQVIKSGNWRDFIALQRYK